MLNVIKHTSLCVYQPEIVNLLLSGQGQQNKWLEREAESSGDFSIILFFYYLFWSEK